MNNQKIENLLNLSLDATMEERDKSMVLNVGYNPLDETWELIVKYHGDLKGLANDVIKVEELLAGYAIVTIPQSLIGALADMEEVEYIEKPKRLFFSVNRGKQASCFLQVTEREPFLTGKGVIVAVIDSGIDYTNPSFRTKEGKTRILDLWDQTVISDADKGFYPPEGFAIGTEFTRNQIDLALAQSNEIKRYEMVPSRDQTSHGTAVTGIAAGNGNGSGGRYIGAAPESDLLIVKLGIPGIQSFPKTTELMRALSYVVQKAEIYAKPVAINLSFGNTYGPHDGTSLLERFIDNIAEVWKNSISVGSGNEGASSGHVSGILRKPTNIQLAVAPYETNLNVQIWNNYTDDFTIDLIAPSGRSERIYTDRIGTSTIEMDNTKLLIYVGEPTPYSVNQEVYIDFLPNDNYVAEGVWTFLLTPVKIVTGEYQFYLPSAVTRNKGTNFFTPSPEVTLTIPSTSGKVITVGGYNTVYDAYADFSGRGYSRDGRNSLQTVSENVKPDLVAPAVNIITTTNRGTYEPFTGTSFATPFVTGAAALLMEWGIVRGNDKFLYGEKVKAYLRKGARQLPGFEYFPNDLVGYGALCVADSLPV